MTWIEQPWFYVDPLATTVGLCITVFAGITLPYSWAFLPKTAGRIRYCGYILSTLAAALGAVFTSNLIVLLVCWGLTALFLYLLIGYGTKKRTPSTAKKTFIIIGGTDAVMMLGVVLIGHLSDSFNIQGVTLGLDEPLAVLAFLCLLVGVLAKVGAIPLHSWLVDTAEDAPTPVTAFLPASVDKLLGIYLLGRMGLDLFLMTPAMYTVLLVIGALTIAVASLLMLVQQDFKRLLGYCAVSQVGYVLLGIGTGHPVGIAGGFFHMVNHAIYKSCLFFAGGAVEKRTHTADIERLGGLSKAMPLIFVSFLIAALSVSGLPPLNGFASKWMVYQGIIESGRSAGAIWIVCLVVAMFGSAFTLAGMMKLVHGIFLGQPASNQLDGPGSSPVAWLAMSLPPILLALLCVVFGLWAYALPLRYLIFPILAEGFAPPVIWPAGLATILIIVGIGLGLVICIATGFVSRMRTTEAFIGGENLDAVPGMRVSGGAFYDTVQALPGFRSFLGYAQRGILDPYEFGTKLTLGMHRLLGALHDGILSTYLSWCLLGMGLLFFVLLIR